ncbi:uncharacterized protein TNCV_1592521 [Trichonephila clavipes]|nr:uncharacterized protein TNCV_1592521 [Trichonephila clavipes]
MPGKSARRNFSQLSEFERDLIIGMKTAGWYTRHVTRQVDRSECAVRNCWEQWTREGTHARKTGSGANRKTTRREDQRIVPHSDSVSGRLFSDRPNLFPRPLSAMIGLDQSNCSKKGNSFIS